MVSNLATIYRNISHDLIEGRLRVSGKLKDFDSGDGRTLKQACYWITNLPIDDCPPPLELPLSYDPQVHPFIEVAAIQGIYFDKVKNHAPDDRILAVHKVSEIPCDYDGLMAVPVNFIEHHNPHQFELVGWLDSTIIDTFGNNLFKRPQTIIVIYQH